MKKTKRYTLLAIAAVGCGLVTFGFIKSGVFAASTPSLGAAASYGILANTYTNTAAGTTINGDVGFTVGPTIEPDPVGGHTHYGSGAPYTTAGADQVSALSALNTQGCTTTFPAAVDLFLDTTHGTPGVYNPGVYCSIGAMSASGSITLSGSGTYIFRSVGALNTTAGITVNLAAGASACDVFWTPSGDTTLGASTAFKGTVIQNGDITIGAGTAWVGRALAFSGAITSGANSSITAPTCVPPPATFHVVKQVVNNSGGSAVASSFNLHVKSLGTDVSGSPAAGASSPGTSYSLAAGTYVVSEDTNTAYTQSFSGDCNSSGSIILASGEDKTCTITNDDRPGTITVTKTVVNDNGGTKTVTDFPLFVSGTPVTSGTTTTFLARDSYTITETADPNYTQTFSGDCDSSGNLNLSPGDNKICTITNNDIAPTLHVIKHVVNSRGGTATASSFNLHVKLAGTDVAGSPAVGADTPGNSYSLNSGTYTVSEDTNTGYTQIFSGDCNSGGSITLSIGQDKTCTITNTDTPSTLHVIKQVVNNSSGTAVAADFTLHVKSSGVDVAGSPAAGAGAPGTAYSLAAGSYTISEDTNASYSQTFTGDCSSDGTITLELGADKTCIVTNNDVPATIRVVTVVINDSGGTKTVADFPLFVDGTPVTSGTSSTFVPGSHAVTETTDPNYIQTFSGDCDVSGNVSLSLGDAKVCTITNNDIGVPVITPPTPPLITVVKVPSPLTLPSGPGPVTYTYTLRNIGTVTATNITMADDSCSPLSYISGDTNANAHIEVSENWTYTCQTILPATHTNNATATGLGNGITATDIASATTVVGSSAVPPLIHVTNIPNLFTLTPGGLVIYTQKVTNPGTTPLSNVIVTNDTFPLGYISGDTNNDSKLDPTETWIYTGQINLTKTTTTTTTVTGEANGLRASDFAFATVVVGTAFPKFPNTGISGEHESKWGIVISVGVAVILCLSCLAQRKRLRS